MNAQTVKALTAEAARSLGLDSGHKMIQADVKAAKTKRETLLQAAKKVAGDEQAIKAFLEGYAQAFTDAGHTDVTVRNRKADAKNVISAVAATLVSGENLAKLEEHQGDYNSFIALSRELKLVNGNKQNKGQGERGKRIKEKLTPQQQDNVETAIEDASPQQISEIVTHGVNTLAKKAPKPVIAGYQSFLAMQAICTQMLKMELEPVFLDAVKSIDKTIGKVIEQARAAAEMGAEAGKEPAKTEPVKTTEPETTV